MRVADILDLLSGANAVLILGDLADTSGDQSSLHLLRRRILESLKMEEDGQLTLQELVEYSRENPRVSIESLLATHLKGITSDRESLVRVMKAPWERVYSISGLSFSNIHWDGLTGVIEYHQADEPLTRLDESSLLIDFAPDDRGRPSVLFEAPHASSDRGIWYKELQAKCVAAPVVLVARASDDLLWSCLDVRRHGSDRTRKAAQPRCVLVLETVANHDRIRARNVEVDVVQGTLNELADALKPGDMRFVAAKKLRSRLRRGRSATKGVETVQHLLKHDQEQPLTWDFLRGFDPAWRDVAAGRPVRTQWVEELNKVWASRDVGNADPVVLRGRAGSGKTTSLMMFARELVNQGHNVVWIDRNAGESMRDLEDEVLDLDPECVIVDDADIFGESTPNFLRRISKQGKRMVLASVRTTRDRLIGNPGKVQFLEEKELGDREIRALDGLLRDAGLLGSLQGIQHDETRWGELRRICQRDLLGALIEVVTGQKFEDRIQEEFDQLTEQEKSVYAEVAVLVSRVGETAAVSREDLIQFDSGSGGMRLRVEAIEQLLAKKLLVLRGVDVSVRHRAIARALVDRSSEDVIAKAVASSLQFYAARGRSIEDSAHPYRRTMISLLSHNLMRELRLSPLQVRELYSGVQRLLEEDFNFWLQRGAYETEAGDLETATSYLKSARSCQGGLGDYKVITESGILALRRAAKDRASIDKDREAAAAMKELFGVIRSKGDRSPHTFRVLALQGADFLEQSNHLSDEERTGLRAELDAVVSLGLEICGDNATAMRELKRYEQKYGVQAEARDRVFPMPQVDVKPSPRLFGKK